MDLPRVTLDEFLKFDPCWANNDTGMRRLKYYARKLGGSANALDILRLNRIPADDRLWAVLREDFVPAEILHEFACRCADRALSRVDNPDQRSVAAVAAKRKWLRGEIGDQELLGAWTAARAAERDAAWDAARDAAWTAAWDAARDAARAAARDAAWTAARDAAWAAAWAAERDAAWAAEQKEQIKLLISMLEGYECVA